MAGALSTTVHSKQSTPGITIDPAQTAAALSVLAVMSRRVRLATFLNVIALQSSLSRKVCL
jgi:hypothetical protein